MQCYWKEEEDIPDLWIGHILFVIERYSITGRRPETLLLAQVHAPVLVQLSEIGIAEILDETDRFTR